MAGRTRRGFLAAAATATTAAVAGCAGLDDAGPDTEIDTYRLPGGSDVGRDSEVEPVVVDAVPVAIGGDYLRGSADRVGELLGRLPIPFGPADVPNGHVRGHLMRAASDAATAVEDARSAGSELLALRRLRDARERARYAAAGWAVAADDRTAQELRTERREAVVEALSFRDDRPYVGSDPVRAALVHGRVEGLLGSVRVDLGPPTAHGGPGSLLSVAEWGEHAESARAALADSRHLHRQFVASLPADAGDVSEVLSAAAETLFADVRRRREALPPERTTDDRESLWRLRRELRREATSGPNRAEDADGPASAVLAATGDLIELRAYDRVDEGITADDLRAASAADIRELRSGAVEAIRAALEESPRPALARHPLAAAATTVALADRELARLDRRVAPGRLADPVRRYTAAAARARSVPPTCRQVVDAL